jgi:hypothetical protein
MVVTDEDSGEVVPGHDFHLSIPGQTEKAVERFIEEAQKFGSHMSKLAREKK